MEYSGNYTWPYKINKSHALYNWRNKTNEYETNRKEKYFGLQPC